MAATRPVCSLTPETRVSIERQLSYYRTLLLTRSTRKPDTIRGRISELTARLARFTSDEGESRKRDNP